VSAEHSLHIPGQINKHPGGGIQIVELLRVYPDIKLPSDEPDDYEDAETPEERREALRNQVHGVPPEALTEQSKALAEMTKQLGAKDEVIAKLVLDGAAERRALLDQFDALTTKLLPAPEAVEGRPSRRTGLFRWRKRK